MMLKMETYKGEIWRKCVAPYTRYEVSNTGRVRNSKEEVIRQFLSKNGYLRVNLWHKGHFKSFYVHRLVALSFCEGYCVGLEVDHVNMNKTDNRAVNLRWATSYENKQNKKVVEGCPILCFKVGERLPSAIYRSCHELEKIEGGAPRLHLQRGMTFHGMRLVRISADEYNSITELMERGYTLGAAWVDVKTRLPL